MMAENVLNIYSGRLRVFLLFVGALEMSPSADENHARIRANDAAVKSHSKKPLKHESWKTNHLVWFHGGRQTDANLYIVANNLPSIAGRDLIQALGLRINGESLTVRVCVAENNQTSNNILSNFPSLLDDSLGTYPGHRHVVSLSDDFQPHATKVRPVPLTKRDSVMAEIKSMVDNGIWSPVDKSKCVHAMVTVGKKDGGVRITSDLSPLNKYVIPDRHPLPRIEDLFLKLRGMSHYLKIDLRKGYYHIELDDKSKRFTATITPLGLMAYNRLPMGLKDAASVFQKSVSRALENCANTIAFVDDILVFGFTKSEHDTALKKALSALAAHQFRINPAKSLFGVQEVTFLGFRLNKDGIHPNPDKIAPIKEAPCPTNVKQVQSFLGAVNYLADFVPELADKAEPLRLLTRKDEPFRWNEPQATAFRNLKDAISKNLELAIYVPQAPTFVTVDASDIGLGAQLSQMQNGREVPVQFASHTLLDRERNFRHPDE